MNATLIVIGLLLIAASAGSWKWSQDRAIRDYSFKVGPLKPGQTVYPIGVYDKVGTKLRLSFTSIDGASQSLPIVTIESNPIIRTLNVGSIPVHLTVADRPQHHQ